MNDQKTSVQYVALPGGTSPAAVVALIDALTDLFAAPTPEGELYQGPLAIERHERKVLVPVSATTQPQMQAELADVVGRISGPLPPTVDVIISTSGSTTGTGSIVGISATALRASAAATNLALGGEGRWILALPVQRIAGFQVVSRSVLAGTRPTVVDTSRGFRPDALARAVTRTAADGQRVYLSLVPTQLVKVLEAGEEVVSALSLCAAILVGGAASTPALLDRAAAAGLKIVTTYGMTETCGGCVYDGLPLKGTEVVTVDDRIMIASSALMEGYLDERSGQEFVSDGVRKWFRTSDCGHMAGPRIVVDGRLDDIINTGGVKVPASKVRESVLKVPGVKEAHVVAVPDERWGSLVTAVVVPSEDVDVRLVNPLRKLAGLPLLEEELPAPEPVWPAAQAEAVLPSIQMTPVEAAMAAMAARIKGADVDVVQAARTGMFTPPSKEFLPPQLQAEIEGETPESGGEAVGEAGTDSASEAAPETTPDTTPETTPDTAPETAAETAPEAATSGTPSALEPTAAQSSAAPAPPEPNQPAPSSDIAEGDNLAVRIRKFVAEELGRAQAPRAVVLLEYMPMVGPGKVDRSAVQAVAEHEVLAGRAWVR